MSKVHIRTERRSLRLWINIPVRASSKNADGKEFSEDTETIVINAHGGLFFLHQSVKSAPILSSPILPPKKSRHVELSPWAILRTRACVLELNFSRLARGSGASNSRLMTGTPIKVLGSFPGPDNNGVIGNVGTGNHVGGPSILSTSGVLGI